MKKKTKKSCCCRRMGAALDNREIDALEDGYYISGCCGGGCWVLKAVPFCPFCGAAFAPKSKEG